MSPLHSVTCCHRSKGVGGGGAGGQDATARLPAVEIYATSATKWNLRAATVDADPYVSPVDLGLDTARFHKRVRRSEVSDEHNVTLSPPPHPVRRGVIYVLVLMRRASTNVTVWNSVTRKTFYCMLTTLLWRHCRQSDNVRRGDGSLIAPERNCWILVASTEATHPTATRRPLTAYFNQLSATALIDQSQHGWDKTCRGGGGQC